MHLSLSHRYPPPEREVRGDMMVPMSWRGSIPILHARIFLSLSRVKPTTSFKDFDALDLRVAEIMQAKKVRKTKKLMELTVRMGDEERTVVSGIATDFEEAELVGKKVTLLANLKPRSLKGIESQGMILLGENQGGHLVFVGPEDQTTASGTPIK